MGNKEAKQDRKPSLEDMAASSREKQTPSLQDIAAARQHKQSAEAGLRAAAQDPGHSSHTLSAQEAPTVPPLPSTARDDDVDKALRDATHVASRMQQQVGGGSYHTPEPLPGHPPGQPLKKEDADALRTGPGKGPPAGRLSTPYFGPASPSEPPNQGERAVGSDVLSKDQDARPSKLLTAGVPSMSGTPPTPEESSPASNARERASRYIKTGDDPTFDPVLRAKQQAAEALEHRMPPPYAHPHDADPQRPETSVYYEHGKKHVVHDGTDEVVKDHGSVPQAQKMKTPFAPEANLEQVSGVQEPPKKEQWKEAGPRAAEAASNLALKAVQSGEKAKEEVKEAIYGHEPVSLAPAQQKEQGATPRPGEPDSEPRSHEPAPAAAEGEEDDEPAWMKPMTPEAELYHARYARSVQIPSPTPQQISPEEQIASEPYTSAEPAPAAGSEGGLLDTFILGITSGVDKLLGRGHEREEDKIPVSQVLDPVDTPYPGDQEASSPDELSGHVPAPGIVIGPTQGGPCLGSVPEAEDAASWMHPASPTEPPAFYAHSAEEAAVPPAQLPRVASGVIVCSETGWSRPHLDELSSHLHPGSKDPSADEGTDKTLRWAEATAEAAGVSVPHSQAGDEAFALAARGALGMDDDSPTPAK